MNSEEEKHEETAFDERPCFSEDEESGLYAENSTPKAVNNLSVIDESKAFGIPAPVVEGHGSNIGSGNQVVVDESGDIGSILNEKRAIAARSAWKWKAFLQRANPKRVALRSSFLDEKRAFANRSEEIRNIARQRDHPNTDSGDAIGSRSFLEEKRAIEKRSTDRNSNLKHTDGGLLDEKHAIAKRGIGKRKALFSGCDNIDNVETRNPSRFSARCDEDASLHEPARDARDDVNGLRIRPMQGGVTEHLQTQPTTRGNTPRLESGGMAPGAFWIVGSTAVATDGLGMLTPTQLSADRDLKNGPHNGERPPLVDNKNGKNLLTVLLMIVAIAVGVGVGLSYEGNSKTSNSATTTLAHGNEGAKLSAMVSSACENNSYSLDLLPSIAIARGKNLTTENPLLDFNKTLCSYETLAFWWLVGDDLSSTDNTRGRQHQRETR